MRRAARIKKKLSFHVPRKIRWVFFLSLLLFLGGAVWFFMSQSLLLKRNFRTTILFHTQPLSVLSFSETAEEPTVLFLLPNEAQLTVPYGYGVYRSDSLWKLAELEKKPLLITETLSDLLGMKVVGWVGTQEVKLDTTATILEQIKKNFTPLGLFLGESNLPLVDRVLLSITFLSLRPEQVRVYDTAVVSSLFSEQELPDGQKVQVPDLDAWTDFLEPKLALSQIREEGISIEVINHTDVPHVGRFFSRYIRTMGGKVTAIGNSKEFVNHCEIVATKTYWTTTVVRYLTSEFQCDLKDEENSQRGEVVVRLGETFGTRWKFMKL